MMIRALNTIALVVAIVLAFALYKAKTEAHAALDRLDELALLIEDERRASAVLRAEIAFLERPERLRALAARHLGLEPTDPAREMTMEGTLLALGMQDPGAVRFADAPVEDVAPGAAQGAAAVAVAAAGEDPLGALIEGAAAPAAQVTQVALAEAPPAPAAITAPAPQPIIDTAPVAPVAVAEAQPAPQVAVNLLPPAEDPIAGLIIAAGGLQ